MDELALPASWGNPLLGDVCEILAGYGFPTALQGKSDGLIPFYKVGDISEAWKGGKIVLDNANNYLDEDEMKSLGARPLPKNTTVFAKIGAAISLNRRALLSCPALIDNNCMGVAPPDGEIDPKYVFYFMCTQKLGDVSRGGIVPSLRKSDIGNVRLPLAPRGEQYRVVAKVEELLTDLDAGIAALERGRTNLKRYRAAVLKAAVKGKLTEQWRKAHPDVEPASKLLERILAERRKKWEEAQLAKFATAGKPPPKGWKERYPEPARPDVTGPQELPEGWCWVTVEQCAGFADNAITDGPFGSNLKTEHYTTTGPRVIRLQNIGDGAFIEQDAHISGSHFRRLSKHQVESGDVVVAMLGEVLPRACIVPDHVPPAIVKADCAKVSANRDLCSNLYLALALNSQLVREYASRKIKGVGRPRLNLSHIRQLALPLPPRDEQDAIVSVVEQSFSQSEQASNEIKTDVERADRLRQAILKRAFVGKLVPQDPKDEPASVLLERIRAARTVKVGSNGERKKVKVPISE